MIYIGCDVGTSSTKAIAVDESGKILAQASKGYGLIQLHPNWAEQEPDLWLEGAVSAVRGVVEQVDESRIKGICISALYGGTGAMLDEDMKAVRPALIWMDRRADEESEWVRRNVGEQEIFDVTGNGIDSYFGYTKLLWVKHHEPENWKRIRWVLPSNTYITCKLTGKLAADYSSAGNFGGVYDCQKRTWSEKMCGMLGIPLEFFPQHLEDGFRVVGNINEEYSEVLGLKHKVPLCVGTIDCIAAMLSAGALECGSNAAVLGTSLNWGIIHEGRTEDPRIISMPYVIDSDKNSYSYGGASTAGALPRWFVNNFCGADSGKIYSQVEQEVIDQKIGPGSDGLIVLPYFMGERNPIWDEKAAGVFFGLTLGHTRAHIYHAIQESVAFALLDIMNSISDEKGRPKEVILVGGGSRSITWPQIFADVTGIQVLTPENPVEAPLGDAFMAALACGAKKEFGEMNSWIRMNPAFVPDQEAHQKYSRWFAVYKKLYQDLKADMAERTELLNY